MCCGFLYQEQRRKRSLSLLCGGKFANEVIGDDVSYSVGVLLAVESCRAVRCIPIISGDEYATEWGTSSVVEDCITTGVQVHVRRYVYSVSKRPSAMQRDGIP